MFPAQFGSEPVRNWRGGGGTGAHWRGRSGARRREWSGSERERVERERAQRVKVSRVGGKAMCEELFAGPRSKDLLFSVVCVRP